MNQRTFNQYKDIIYEKSGIKLNKNKIPLLYARIGKRLHALGFSDHNKYLEFLMDNNNDEITQLIDAISTNVTSFFREADHFVFLEEKLKELTLEGQKKFRIWSSACSTGEEPYSIALTVMESLGNKFDTKILATDISTQALEKAKNGLYSDKNIKNISPVMVNNYFKKEFNHKLKNYEVKPVLKNMIIFRRLNLSKPPFPMNGPLDFVFCRNVMIYFDKKTRQMLVDEIYRLLGHGKYLFLGHSESLIGLSCKLNSVKPSIYVKMS
ncbi:chemotaxis protein CheR [Candidatus Poribacteria bacterium]|nr:chemotaxis protein CheR [Candidatus Poribacteria bacterium]